MPEKTKNVRLVKDEELDKVSGGSALDEVPVVDEHDYDENVRDKIDP